MADRITINFAANTEDVETGADRMKDSLKDTQGALDDVGQAGEKAGEKVSDSLDKSGESASAAKGVIGEVGDSLLGVAGLAGGIGGIAAEGARDAIGFIQDLIKKQQDAARELEVGLVNAYKAAAAQGETYLSQAQIIAAATDIYFDKGKLDQAKADAASIGVDVNTYVKSQAGDYAALKVVIDAAHKAEADRLAALQDAGATGKQTLGDSERRNLAQIIAANEKLLGLHDQDQEAAQNTADLTASLEAEQQAAIKRTSDADVARWQAHQKAVEAAQGKTVSVPVVLDTKGFDRDMEALLRKPRAVNVIAKYGVQVP